MSNNEPITKVTQIIPRQDGSEVRIVVEAMYGAGLHQSIDVRVHRRNKTDENWIYCNNQPHPDFKSMSRENYLKNGRSEMLNTVTPAEILKLTKLIGQPMSCLK